MLPQPRIKNFARIPAGDQTTSFRSDIEGLRALAVLAVLGFHFLQRFFPGGFVGVDIFFVISGYLITRNILSEIREGVFSFRKFYARRVRRLFPALFFTIAATLLAGILLASSENLKHIAASSIASIFSVSNIYFWNQSGYFDAAAIQKPLLHTWSLAVEEQFYLIWPLLIVALSRGMKRQWFAVASLFAFGLVSVLAAELRLDADPAGVFYLTPYRISEFVLGALCAWLPVWKTRGFRGEILSVVGLGLIVYPIFGYSEKTPFPGIAALLPCLGASILIFFAGGVSSRRILTNPIAAGIGKISYSLYLAHWPVYVFYRQWKGGVVNAQDTFIVSLASVVLAMLMVQFIEKPFRAFGPSRIVRTPTLIFFKLFSVFTTGVILLAAVVWFNNGWSWRYPVDVTRLVKEAGAERRARSSLYQQHCSSKNSLPCDAPATGINIFVMGDSHAIDAFNALVGQYPEFHYVYYGGGGCSPVVKEDFNVLPENLLDRNACIARNEKIFYGEQLVSADMVVINAHFTPYKPEYLRKTIFQIRRKTNAPVVVFGNYLRFAYNLPDLVEQHGITRMDDFYRTRLDKTTFGYEAELEALSKELGFLFVSLKKLFCESDSLMDCPIMFDGKLFTYDKAHFSLAATKRLGLELEKVHGKTFRQLKRKKGSKGKNGDH